MTRMQAISVPAKGTAAAKDKKAAAVSELERKRAEQTLSPAGLPPAESSHSTGNSAKSLPDSAPAGTALSELQALYALINDDRTWT